MPSAAKARAAKSYSVVAKSYAKGVNLTAGAENLPPDALTIANNVRFSQQGGWYVRAGFTKQAALAAQSKKVQTLYPMPTYAALFAQSDTKIYQSVNGSTWYDIGATLTTGLRTAFQYFRKDIFAVNTTDSFLRIACSTLSADADTVGHILTIKTGDIGQFAASGTVYVRGIAITYSGVSGSTLTGTSGETTAMKSGDIITQTSNPATAAYNGSCISYLQGSVLVAGKSADPTILYYSAPSDATSAGSAYPYDFQANGAGTSGAFPSAITCLYAGAQITLVGTKRGIYYLTGFDPDTNGLTPKPVSDVHEVPNQFCITSIDENLFAVFTGRRILLITRDVYGVRIADDPENPLSNFDYNVRKYLQSLDPDQSLSWIHFDPVTRELYCSVISNGISQILVNNVDLRAWSVDTSKPYSCMANFKYRVYAGDDNNDNVYLDNDGVRDNLIAINAKATGPVYTVDQKRVSSDYTNVAFSGLLSGNGQFAFRIFVTSGGTLQAFSFAFTAADLQAKNLMDTASAQAYGNMVFGSSSYGASGLNQETFPFSCPIQLLLSGEKFQLEWEVTDEGTQLEIRDSKLDAQTAGALYADSF